jgi:ribosomal subunit interface protein
MMPLRAFARGTVDALVGMSIPVQITFRNMEPSDALDAAVRDKTAKLERVFDRISGVRVVIERPHRHHHEGGLHHVRVDVRVPGREIVASRDPGADHAHEDAYVAVRDAFDAVQRQLEEYVRTTRGRGRIAAAGRARVARVDRERNVGVLETSDAGRVAFHRDGVVDGGFDELVIGTEVWFLEQDGDAGVRRVLVATEAARLEARG